MKLHPASQLLMRNVEDLFGDRILVVDSPSGEIGPALLEQFPDAQITLVQTEYSDYRRAEQRNNGEGRPRSAKMRVRFCAWHASPQRRHDAAVIYLPKSKAMLDLLLEMVRGAVAPRGAASPGRPEPARVLLVGLVRGGIKSSRPAFERRFGPAEKLDVARRCVLYAATVTHSPPGQPRLDEWGTVCTFEVLGPVKRSLRVFSFPGVFSHGRLDDGTRLLLETLDPPGASSDLRFDRGVLDFGCGCGVIGAWVHTLRPDTRIELVDSNALALEAARRTAAIHGLPAESVFPSDVFFDVRGRYGLILSNPPFHAGFRTDYAVVEGFLAGAADRLVNGGALRLVANRFHKYRSLLQKHVGPCRTVAENSRYRVYEAVLSR